MSAPGSRASVPTPRPELQLLRPDHAPALLSFEETNRAYFAATVPDRGDAYFRDFDARHHALLDEQAAGVCRFHVLVGDGGEIVGRINLLDLADGCAELGYRIAEKATGQGLATWAVRQVCDLAVTTYGLTGLRAATTHDNPGSRAVLTRTGFVPVGDVRLGGVPGTSFALTL
ncbi:GNAT family N-acetyltransferase [Streptomyces sp. NPDC058308]|uniref:GNAT family N-acetyltransferase n=1 Tax=Streptomyces sp. NPDC058308 TaxID=3346440 RepID=UPI0036E8B7D9